MAESSKKTREATRMKHLALKRLTKGKVHVEIDPHTRRAKGPNRKDFVSYLGVLARSKLSILKPKWDHVTEADKNMIWQDIRVIYLLNLYILTH